VYKAFHYHTRPFHPVMWLFSLREAPPPVGGDLGVVCAGCDTSLRGERKGRKDEKKTKGEKRGGIGK